MLQNQYTPINKMTPGETYNRPVLVMDMDERTARTGNTFVSFKLTDGDTVIKVNAFDVSIDDMHVLGISPGCIADATIYIKEPYYNLSNISLCSNPDICVSDFVRSAPGDPSIMFEDICAQITASADASVGNELSKLTISLLRKYASEYCKSSAAKSIHHNMLGGLLYHSHRMVLSAVNLCKVYASLDKELLVCSAAIHDIGKIRELSTSNTGEAYYTVPGRLFGHAEIGIEMINEEIGTASSVCSERIILLKHCIASHHGKAEWGALVPPAIIEAQALHLIDLLDAKMYQFEDAYSHTEEEKLSGKIFGLDNNTVFHPVYDPFKGLFDEGGVHDD